MTEKTQEEVKTYKPIEQYPLILDPMHVKEIMGIGRKQAYEFISEVEMMNRKGKNPPFHVKRFGKLYKIPRDQFFDWVNGRNGAGA